MSEINVILILYIKDFFLTKEIMNIFLFSLDDSDHVTICLTTFLALCL